MKKGGGSESTIIVGPSKSVLVYALHSLEYVLGLADFGCSCQTYILYIKYSIRVVTILKKFVNAHHLNARIIFWHYFDGPSFE